VNRTRALQSLRAKILVAVILSAVVPLAIVGAWLTSAASRSGKLLLRSQLDSAAERAALTAREHWMHRQSDVLLLSQNEPIRAALAAKAMAATPPEFIERAFKTMPAIAAVVVRDAGGRTVWTLGDVPLSHRPATTREESVASISTAETPIRVVVRADDDGQALGEVIAFVRIDALVPASASLQSAGTEFIAVHDRAEGAWVRPATLTPALLSAGQFDWDGHRWVTVRRSLNAPAIDIVAAGRLDPFVEPFAHTAAAGATALAIVAIAVVVVTILVAGRLTSSLAQLAEAADAVSRGDLESQLDVRSRDEVGRVAHAFNIMTENVRRMMRELSQQEAIAAMGELAATVAHQVRSPATAIRLDVQRAHDKLPAESPERSLLARALEQLDRMERAIAGSLKVARAGGAGFREVDVREPLRRAISGAELECSKRGVRLDASQVSDCPLTIRGDTPSLEQLFANVLGNAVHASSAGSRVSIAASGSSNEHVTVAIQDEGMGMNADTLERAGEPLFSTKAEGTGLGLAIAKRIASAHRGRISIASVPGEGTRVVIDLPT